jgi:hypothetical protein
MVLFYLAERFEISRQFICVISSFAKEMQIQQPELIIAAHDKRCGQLDAQCIRVI